MRSQSEKEGNRGECRLVEVSRNVGLGPLLSPSWSWQSAGDWRRASERIFPQAHVVGVDRRQQS